MSSCNSLSILLRRSFLLASLLLLSACTTPRVFTDKEVSDAGQKRMQMLEERRNHLADGITLAEAMTWAMDNNLSLRAESLERAVATGNRKLATVAMLPSLSAQAGYRWRSNVQGSSSQSVTTGKTSLEASTSSDQDSWTASLEASWNVLDFGLAWLRARQEGEKENISLESRRRMSHQLALELVSSWDKAVAYQRIEPELDGARADIMMALRQTDAIAASRLRDPVDVLEYRSALLLFLKRMNGLVLLMDQSNDELARLMGLPAGSKLKLVSVADDLGMLPAADLKAWQYVALLNRPEIRQSLYAKRSADRSAYRRLVEQMPSLLLRYGSSRDSNSFLVNNTWDDANVSLSIGLIRLATLPLQKNLGDIERAQAETQADLQATAVLSQVAIAGKADRAAQRFSCLSKEIASASESKMGLLEARAKAASIDELSMIRARVDNILVRIEYDIAEADARRATLMLAQSVGIGALPDQVDAAATEAKVAAVKAWLQSGIAGKAQEQLLRVEKEMGVPLVQPGAEGAAVGGVVQCM